jgi:hypothetical protein
VENCKKEPKEMELNPNDGFLERVELTVEAH